MSIVKVQGNASGTGILTIAAPNTNTDRTLTLPDNTGTLLSSASTLAATSLSGRVPAANAPSGSVIQVVNTMFNPSTVSTTSTSYVDSGLSLGITLSSASNRVLILVNGGHSYVNSYPNGMIETICRQSSTTYSSGNDLANTTYGLTQIYNSTNLNTAPHSMNTLDTTPGSTTPTYRVFFRSRSGGSVIWQEGSSFISMTLMEIVG